MLYRPNDYRPDMKLAASAVASLHIEHLLMPPAEKCRSLSQLGHEAGQWIAASGVILRR